MRSLNLPETSEDHENLIGQNVCACQPDTGSAVMAPVVRSVSELSLSDGVLGSNAASCLGTQPKLFCMGHACRFRRRGSQAFVQLRKLRRQEAQDRKVPRML